MDCGATIEGAARIRAPNRNIQSQTCPLAERQSSRRYEWRLIHNATAQPASLNGYRTDRIRWTRHSSAYRSPE